MTTIVTRAGKGSPLTHNEVDSNFTNLNNDKIEASQSVTLTNKTLGAGTAITAGTINNAVIGGSTPAAGTFTSLSDSGNLTFTGTGNRITGDFSNATHVNRVAFQTSTTNGATSPFLLPNGSSSTTQWVMSSAADPTNCSYMSVGLIAGAEARVTSGVIGSGTYLPMTFHAGANERMRIVGGTGSDVGYVGIGTISPGTVFQVSKASTSTIVGSSTAVVSVVNSQSSALGETAGIEFFNRNVSGSAKLAGVYGLYENYNATGYAGSLVFATETAGASNVTERMRINSDGNVGIGAILPNNKLEVNGSFYQYTAYATIGNFNAGITGASPTSNSGLGVSTNITNGQAEVDIWNTPDPATYANTGILFTQRLTSTTRRDLMFLHNNGNVGIGTNSPSKKLDVFNSGTTTTDFVVRNGTVSLLSFVDSGGGYTGTSTNHPLLFTTNNTEKMRIDANGKLGIGTTPASNTVSILFTAGDITAVGGSRGFLFNAYYNTTNLRWEYAGTGTAAGWVDIGSGSYQFLSTGATSGTVGAVASFTPRMTIDASGNVLVTGAGGLGYGTGSGGAVTQTTSRTTGVTLNKTNGAITLVSAAGSIVFQSFTVTNSTVAATDVIHVVQKSGTDKYAIWVTNVAAGSFQITFATLAGTTTEQPVFNFAVIKAVTA